MRLYYQTVYNDLKSKLPSLKSESVNLKLFAGLQRLHSIDLFSTGGIYC